MLGSFGAVQSASMGVYGRLSGFSAFGLFSGGGVGLLYNSSDLSTLFQDSSGKTPVTTAGQSNGLTLDKSEALALGPELVPNGTFESDTTGTTPNTWETNSANASLIKQSDGTALFSSSSFAYARITDADRPVLPVGVSQVSFEISEWVSGLNNMQVGIGAGGNLIGGNGSYLYFFTSSAEQSYEFQMRPNSGGTGNFKVDNISVRDLAGNHAIQTSTSFRSKYQTGPDRKAYDGIDDRDNTTLKPTTSGTLAVRMRGNAASKVAIGSQPASDGRCYIGLASDGSLAGGIGTQATSVIKGSTDVRTDWVTGILTWDGSTVTLYQDGVSVYSAAQSGAVNTTIDLMVGALNNNGTAAAFHAGDIARALVLNRAITATEVTDLSTLWSTIS